MYKQKRYEYIVLSIIRTCSVAPGTEKSRAQFEQHLDALNTRLRQRRLDQCCEQLRTALEHLLDHLPSVQNRCAPHAPLHLVPAPLHPSAPHAPRKWHSTHALLPPVICPAQL